jgi:hypothetical protein
MEGGMCANRQRGSFLIGHLPRFCDHRPVFGQTFILGVGAKMCIEARCKHLVTDLKALDSFADGFHVTSQLHAEDRMSWFAEP